MDQRKADYKTVSFLTNLSPTSTQSEHAPLVHIGCSCSISLGGLISGHRGHGFQSKIFGALCVQ